MNGRHSRESSATAATSEGTSELATEVDSSVRVNIGAGAAEPMKYRARLVVPEERGRATDGHPAEGVQVADRRLLIPVPTRVAVRDFAVPATARVEGGMVEESSRTPTRKVSKSAADGKRSRGLLDVELPRKTDDGGVPPVRGSYFRRMEESTIGKNRREKSIKEGEKRRARR